MRLHAPSMHASAAASQCSRSLSALLVCACVASHGSSNHLLFGLRHCRLQATFKEHGLCAGALFELAKKANATAPIDCAPAPPTPQVGPGSS